MKDKLLGHAVFKSRPLRSIVSLAEKEGVELYLVGGFLRDLALCRKKASLDLDFSLEKGAIEFGRKVAKNLKAGFVILDKEHGCSRVVYKDPKDKSLFTFDFVDFRGRTIKEDLLKRDFTVNTLACRVPFQKPLRIIDYCQAGKDLRQKLIRAVFKDSFDEDPLRVLRAFSMASLFGFKITPETLSLIRKKKDGLCEVAGERVRDEFFKILSVEDSVSCIGLMDRSGVLEKVIPQLKLMHNVRQGAYHHLDVWGHSLETVKKLEELILKFKDHSDVTLYLDENLVSGRQRRQLLKLAALLHDIGKPEAFEVKAGKTMFHGHERMGRIISDSVSERLKLSTRERFALDTIIFWHLRPGYLADNAVLTERAIHRFFRDTGTEAVSVLLISIADQRATRGPLASAPSRVKHEKVSFALIERYFKTLREKPFKRLISGKDLIKKLKLQSGPIFSTILNAVEEAQVEGRLKTKAQALSFARKIIKNHSKDKLAEAKPQPKRKLRGGK